MTTPLRAALISYALVATAVAACVRIDVDVPLIGHLGSALVAVILLYAPVIIAWRLGEDLDAYGFRAAPLGQNLKIGLGVCAVVFPLFFVAFIGFYEVICDANWLAKLAPPGTCHGYRGISGIRAPLADPAFAEFVLVQLVVVALPEELFFRGAIFTLLERAWPAKRRFLGAPVGWAIVVSAALFALIHLPKDGDPRALATFFPGLMFGWMRAKTGSILAPTLAHAGSNIFIRLLEQMVLR